MCVLCFFFFSSRRRHTRCSRDWSSDVCSSDLIVEALADLPEGTVVDGELVAIDDSGRTDFNLLQNFRSEAFRIHYYVFDLLCWKDRDLTRLPLVERRALLKSLVVVRDTRIRIS